VRAAEGGSGEVVVAARDGSRAHTLPVFGPAALAFNPDGSWLASIGARERSQSTLAIPVGPIRLIDTVSGRTRTLVDGSVVAFWWSPDGRTIAALRVQPIGDAVSIASPVPSPSEGDREVRLLFVDVASGEIGPDMVIRPGGLYVDQLLSYFDQYALSHRLWAPDGSSILVPVVAANGTTRVAVVFRNGDPSVMLVGQIGFWSP
jgi:TolB protein